MRMRVDSWGYHAGQGAWVPLVGALLLQAVAPAVGADSAAGAESYNLTQCIEIGLTNSAAAANARRDEAISAARVRQTRAEALPSLSVNAAYTRLDEVAEISFGEGESVEAGTLDNYSVEAQVGQLLYSGGRVNAALRAAHLAKDLAAWGRLDTESVLVRDIRTGFYDILLAGAAVEVREESVRQMESLLGQTEIKFKNGTASEFEVLTAKVRLANEQPPLIDARNAHAIATENFRRLLMVEDRDFRTRGELTFRPLDVDLESLQSIALTRRPALHEAEQVAALREQDVRAARSGYYPEVRAQFSYTGANSYRFASFEDEWEWHWNAGVVLDWSLFDGWLTRASVEEKRLEFEKSLTDTTDLRNAVKLEVSQAYLDMRRAEESATSNRGNVALAKKGLSIARTRYESGLSTYLEFTDSNLALSTARLSRHRALRDHMAAVAQLAHACGVAIDELSKKEE